MRKGFTLLEIMVAMALLFIVLATVYESFRVHVKSIAMAREVQTGVRASRLAFAMIAKDLQSAFREDDQEGEPQSGDEEKPPVVYRPNRTGGQKSEGPYRLSDARPLVEPRCRAVSEAPRGRIPHDRRRGQRRPLGVDAPEDLTPDGDILTGGSAWTLVEKVLGFEVLCTDDDGNDMETWDSKEQKKLPKSVIIRLWIGDSEDSDTEDTDPFTLRVAIPSRPEEETE